MAIKKNKETGLWDVSFHRRHPITRVPYRSSRIGIRSEAEAKRVYQELVLQVDTKMREKVMPTWSKLVDDYHLNFLSFEMTKKTADNYRGSLEHHTFEQWADKRIDQISTEDIRQLFRVHLSEKSPSLQKNILKFIRGAFGYALDQNIIVRNPTPRMKFKMGDKIKQVLAEPQVRILLSRAKLYEWEWYPIIATALYTGMRSGELYALTWDKVDFENRRILVNMSWNKVDGFKSTKTGDDRMVEIAAPLLTMLKEMRLQSTSDYVLPHLDMWTSGHQAVALRTFLLGCGLPVIRFHDLRASWATIMLGRGIEPAKVMVMGGWKDLKTLMVYLRKAGISIRGITDTLVLHDAENRDAEVTELRRSN